MEVLMRNSTRRDHVKSRRLRFESLEQRALLSVTAGSEIYLNDLPDLGSL